MECDGFIISAWEVLCNPEVSITRQYSDSMWFSVGESGASHPKVFCVPKMEHLGPDRAPVG